VESTSSIFRIEDPEDGGSKFVRDVCRLKLQVITSQKTVFFIVTAVRTSDPKKKVAVYLRSEWLKKVERYK
jgi:hypothetical protein